MSVSPLPFADLLWSWIFSSGSALVFVSR